MVSIPHCLSQISFFLWLLSCQAEQQIKVIGGSSIQPRPRPRHLHLHHHPSRNKYNQDVGILHRHRDRGPELAFISGPSHYAIAAPSQQISVRHQRLFSLVDPGRVPKKQRDSNLANKPLRGAPPHHPLFQRVTPSSSSSSLFSSNQNINDSSDNSEPRENDENDNQRGMTEAFASLESLSAADLNDATETDDEIASKLKQCRTDNTPAFNSGKATKEEVEHYLEMQQALEQPEQLEDLEEECLDDEMIMDGFELDIEEVDKDSDENNDELSEETFPWSSLNPILRLRGPVASGYGRGGKKLGVPTANLPASLFQSALQDLPTGVYFGWAVIEQLSNCPPSPTSQSSSSPIKKGRNTPIKAVVNVGYSPTFEGEENKEKIVEAHLITSQSPMNKTSSASSTTTITTITTDDESETSSLSETIDEIEGDFYNETMRLQLIGFLRPEQKFDSFPALISQIHVDIGNADWALSSMPFVFSKEDEFLMSVCRLDEEDGGDGADNDGEGDSLDWIGSGGGDNVASWEYESW